MKRFPTLFSGRAVVTGTASSGSTTTLVASSLTAPDGTYIGYQISVPSDSSYVGTVTGYVESTHTLTITTAGGSPSGDAFTLTPVALLTSTGYLADNVQTVSVPYGYSGTYTLTFNTHTTSGTAFSDTTTASAMETELAALTGVGSGQVAVTLTQMSATAPQVYTIRFMGTLAGAYEPPITASDSSVTAVEEIPGGDSGAAATTTDPRDIMALTDTDMAGETLATIAAFSTGVPTPDTDQTTAYTLDGNGDQLTQTAVEPVGTPNEITGYDFGVGGTAGTNLFSNDLRAETQFPDPTTGYASTIAPGASGSGQQIYGYSLQGDTLSFQDQNGTTHSYKLDAVGRDIGDSVTLYSGNPYSVDNTVMSLGYSFNDAGLPFKQTSFPDADETGTPVNQEEDIYNGLQQLTQQFQSVDGTVDTSTTPFVGYNYNQMGDGQNNSKLQSTVYPNGRILDTDYSLLQQPVTGISVSGTTATVTTVLAHGLSGTPKVDIEGSSVSALDGVHTLTATPSSTTFTFTVTSGTASDTSSTDMTETPTAGLDYEISRPDGLQDHAGSAAGTILQSYAYLGQGTIVQENDGNGDVMTYIAPTTPTPTPTPSAPPTTIASAGDRYTGLDRFGRVVFQNWYNAGTGDQTQGDQYGYDNDSNVLYDNVVNQGSTAASYSQLYHASSTTGSDNNNAYDPLNRETTFIRGTLTASGNNTYSSAPLDTVTNANINTADGSVQTFDLDALGNWISSTSEAGTGTSTAPTPSSTSRTTNSQNELTAVGGSGISYDNDGNTKGDVWKDYDAWNRLVVASPDGVASVSYSYLPGTDQAIRTLCGSAAVDSYYSTDMQVLEDDTQTCTGCSSSTAEVQSQYVWGLAYVNQMVERDDNLSAGAQNQPARGAQIEFKTSHFE